MGEKVYNTKDGALFAQIDGPATKPEFIGCVDLDDLSADTGGITLIQCFDVNGEYVTRGFTADAPSPIKTTVTTWIGKTADLLEGLQCPFLLHVNLRCRGKANIFTNYDRGIVLQVAKISNRTMKGLVNRNTQDQAEQSFDLEILPPWTDVFDVSVLRQSVSEVGAVNDLFFIDGYMCASDCGPAVALGDLGGMALDHKPGSVGVTANFKYTTDGGQTWTDAAADPFGAAEDVAVVVGFYITKDTIRWIVGRGTTDAGNPAEIAYTDDNGATWTSVDLGSTNALYFMNKKTIWVADAYNIWAVTGGGKIYKSEDGGLSWTAQTSGTTQNLHGIAFQKGSILNGYAIGASNTILKTNDGGITWSTVTGPAGGAGAIAIALAVFSLNGVWVGYDNGQQWRTFDGGATWTEYTFSGSGAGDVKDYAFIDEVVGYMIHDTAAPVGTVFFTRDGGYTWEAKTTPTNTGLNVIVALKSNLAFAGGEVQAATPVVLKIS